MKINRTDILVNRHSEGARNEKKDERKATKDGRNAVAVRDSLWLDRLVSSDLFMKGRWVPLSMVFGDIAGHRECQIRR